VRVAGKGQSNGIEKGRNQHGILGRRTRGIDLGPPHISRRMSKKIKREKNLMMKKLFQ